MRKQILVPVTALLALVLLFSACGAGSTTARYDTSPPGESYKEAMTVPESADYDSGGGIEYRADSKAKADAPADTKPDAPAAKSSRKLIKDINASVETRQFEKYLNALEAKTLALGGHVESRQTSDNGYGYSGNRDATLILRVPADSLDAFKASLGELGKITSIHESTRDVTSNYVDIQAHITALRTERDSLLKLLDQAKNLEDVIRVQDRLTDVRYQLDSLESQLRTMSDQIALSTVTLQVFEVDRITPDEPEGFWAKTWAGFKENLFSVGRGLRDFTSGLIAALPVLVAIAVPVTLVILLLLRRRKKKRG